MQNKTRLKKFQLLVIAITALTILSSCGWRLRGTLTLPENLNSVYIVNQTSSTDLDEELERLLSNNDVTIAESMSIAQLIITLEEFEEKSRTASLSSAGRTNEYELTSEVIYNIKDQLGNELIPTSEANVIRTYQYDENNVIAAGNEQRLLQQEIRRELAQQILGRLRFIDFSKVNISSP
jgi:LPS-assembly lipoprotein